MKKLYAILLFACLWLLSSCDILFPGKVSGAGQVVLEERQLRGVRGVDLALPGELIIEIGDSEGLTIEAEENLLPFIETSLFDGILILQQPPGVYLQPNQTVRYLLTAKHLDTLQISGSGNITAPSLEAEDFAILIRSSGNIRLAGLTCNRLQVEISSSGKLTIEAGKINEQQVQIHSSGDYDAGGVTSQNAMVEISGSGDALLWVTDELSATLSSSGNVFYFGEPTVSEQTSSSGKAIPRGEK